MKDTHNKMMELLLNDIDEKLKSLSEEIGEALGIEVENDVC